MTLDESRVYSKGYNAGKKIKAEEINRIIENARTTFKAKTRDEIYTQFFCSVLNGLLAGDATWETGAEPVKNIRTYVQLAKEFVEEIMKQLKR